MILCYHEVESDAAPTLTRTAVRVSDLAAQFAWLRANGYHVVSLQQIVDARAGAALPEKAVLLTFDDGRRDVYTRVFPLLKLFGYPAVIALVGRWLEVPPGQEVDYDGTPVPRADFVTWAEVREMQRSGLVEVASHAYDLHRSVVANPQGNTQPAAVARRFVDGRYEADADYLARLRADLVANRDLIGQRTGRAPRAIVWPYGRSNGVTQELAAELGMTVGMTLEDGANTPATPLPVLKRYLIEESPSLQGFAELLRRAWSPDPARSVSVVPAAWSDDEQGLSQALDRLLPLSPNITFVSPLAADGRVLFPTRWRPLAADVLNRVAWQIERRAGSPVFIDLPSAWLAERALLADLARYVNFAGVRLPTFPGDALAERALTTLERWRWPLRAAYASPALPTPEQWARLRAGDLVVLPASPENMAAVPLTEKARVLFEFDPQGMPAVEIAAQMRRLEADGFRQFGLRGFPDAGFEAVWPVLSLRSQPLLP